MTFSDQPTDVNGIPVPSTYVQNDGFVAIQGSANTDTDGLNNTSTAINVNLYQVSSDPTDGLVGADGIPSDGILKVIGALSNGSSYDEPRGNLNNITLINASNVTTTQTSAMQTNFNAQGAVIVFVMIDASSSPSVTLTIFGNEPVTNTDWNILVGLPITANGVYIYRVHPSLWPVANATARDILPRSWGVTATANNSNQGTYMVCANINV